MRRSSTILVFVLLLLGALIFFLVIVAVWVRGFWFTEVFTLSRENESNRQALLRVFKSINVGDSYKDVLGRFYEGRKDDSLELNVGSPDRWTVSTPLEFGASNWVLVIEFQDGQVTAVRVRTADGPAPRDGPADKVANKRLEQP